MPEEAFKVHGFSQEFLSDKETFSQVADEFLNFIKDKKILIAHPSGFLNCKILQFPNKKQMSAIDLLNGSSFSNKLEVS